MKLDCLKAKKKTPNGKWIHCFFSCFAIAREAQRARARACARLSTVLHSGDSRDISHNQLFLRAAWKEHNSRSSHLGCYVAAPHRAQPHPSATETMWSWETKDSVSLRIMSLTLELNHSELISRAKLWLVLLIKNWANAISRTKVIVVYKFYCDVPHLLY